jgi:hypothetical protein
MDSLTQLTFGVACGEAVLGRKVGRKALVLAALVLKTEAFLGPSHQFDWPVSQPGLSCLGVCCR